MLKNSWDHKKLATCATRIFAKRSTDKSLAGVLSSPLRPVWLDEVMKAEAVCRGLWLDAFVLMHIVEKDVVS
jgi:hypothetical protein